MKKAVLFLVAFTLVTSASVPSSTAFPNSAALYCEKSGYAHEIIDTADGEKSVCIFGGGEVCDEEEAPPAPEFPLLCVPVALCIISAFVASRKVY